MNRKLWYLISTTLPFFLPLIFFQRHMDFPSSVWGMFRLILVFQLLYAGIPYLIFCGFFLCWGLSKTAKEIEESARLYPLIFTFFAEIGFYYLQRWGIHFEYRKDPRLVYTALAIIVPLYGYFYLLLICLLTWIFKIIGALKD